MFKETPIGRVIIYAVAAGLMLFTIISTVEKIYETETRPPGTECKEGETKPPAKDGFFATCENGYWQYYPPGLP